MSIKQTTLDLNGPVLEFQRHPQSAVTTGINSAQFTGIATATYYSATTGTTTSLISATYNDYPVRGYLYYPTSSDVGSTLDVVVLNEFVRLSYSGVSFIFVKLIFVTFPSKSLMYTKAPE